MQDDRNKRIIEKDTVWCETKPQECKGQCDNCPYFKSKKQIKNATNSKSKFKKRSKRA